MRLKTVYVHSVLAPFSATKVSDIRLQLAPASMVVTNTTAPATAVKKNRRKTSKHKPTRDAGAASAAGDDEDMDNEQLENADSGPSALTSTQRIVLADDDDAIMIDTDVSPLPPAPGALAFPPVSASAERSTKKSELRRIPIPPHRMTPLKKEWINIFGPLTELLGLQVRMNVQRRSVEIRVSDSSLNCYIRPAYAERPDVQAHEGSRSSPKGC